MRCSIHFIELNPAALVTLSRQVFLARAVSHARGYRLSIPQVLPDPGSVCRTVSSNSVTVITPGIGSSITSTTTVSTGEVGCFIRCIFFRAASFFAACLAFALVLVRFAAFRRADLDALRALPRPAARFLCTFDGFFRLAMLDPLMS